MTRINHATPQRGSRSLWIVLAMVAALLPALAGPAGGAGHITPISEVQGPGFSSPLKDTTVTIQGVVVGDFQEFAEIGRFFVMEETADQDTDPMTSEGIEIADFSTAVSVGDVVEVTGVVEENFGETSIDPDSIEIIGSSSENLAVPLTLPLTASGDLEKYEGMLVTIPQDLYISEYFNYDRFGEIVLATSRQFQPTEIMEPGPAATALADAQRLARITMDDGQRFQNPDFNRHPNGLEFTLENTFRGGDIVRDLTGVLDVNFGFKIQPTTGATYIPTNPRPTSVEVKGKIKVASFNVLNFFATIDPDPTPFSRSDDDDYNVCGPTGLSDCRGADSEEEYERQLSKLIAGIQALDADVIGFQEVENGNRGPDGIPAHDAILAIVEGLNATPGAGTWAWVGEPVLDNGDPYFNNYPIRNEIIYRTDSVVPVGPARTIMGTGCEEDVPVVSCAFDQVRGDDIEPVGRPPVAQTFAAEWEIEDDEAEYEKVFTVIVNHFKSKGSDCDDLNDPDENDGQANCNLTRVAQSEALLAFADELASEIGDKDILIIGDLNSYGMEDPIEVIRDAGYRDLLTKYEGKKAYGYVFDGRFGSLDHALASRGLKRQVKDAASFLINADEPDILDYDTTFKSDAQVALFEPLPYRVSDHDPLVVGLTLKANDKIEVEFDDDDD